MKAIKNTNISLEQKLGRAIEMIENKLDNFFYALSGQVYDTRANMQVRNCIKYIATYVAVIICFKCVDTYVAS